MSPVRVLVTGAASGIGAASAEELRRRGARVIGLDLTVAGEDVLACDVRDQASVDRAVAEAVECLGGLDVLVNNAGLGTPHSAGSAPDAEALAVLDVNLIGPWRVTSAALGALRESRGRLVNVASGLAHLTIPFATAYCMSKRGLVAYSDALRLENGGRRSRPGAGFRVGVRRAGRAALRARAQQVPEGQRHAGRLRVIAVEPAG